MDIFKYYANMSDLTNYIYINYSGFVKFARDCDIVHIEKHEQSMFNFNTKMKLDKKFEKQMILNEKKFTLSQLNILFSKFSSEIPNENHKLTNKFQKDK